MSGVARDGGRRSDGWLRRGFEFLASGRLAVVLLAVLVVLLLLYLFLPQWGPGEEGRAARWAAEHGWPAQLTAALGFTNVRRSTWLYVTFTLVFINLLLCMIRRARAALFLWRLPAAPPEPSAGWSRRALPAGSLDTREIVRLLRARGYRTVSGGGTVYGVRGRFAVIGHWVFHVSLLLLLAVGAWRAARPDPFRGTIGLGEGEPFDLQSAPFLATSIPLSSDLPDLRFALESVDITTDGEELRHLEAHLSTPAGARPDLGINRPFRRHPWQVMVHGFGYMPGWVVVDPRGRMLSGAWVKLVPFPIRGEDSFPIGHAMGEVTVRFFPNHTNGANGDATDGHALGNPRFRTTIRLDGEAAFAGLLAPGQRVSLGDGREFFFLPEIRRYLLLDVIREGEYRFVFAALGIMILGLALRYARLRKEVLVQAGGGAAQVHGRCEILESLFEEELDRLTAALTQLTYRTEDRRAAS